MDDIRVKESDALRQYANKLVSFRDGVLSTGFFVYMQSKKVEKDLKRQIREMERLYNITQENARLLKSNYEYALDECRNAESVIGEAKHDLENACTTLENDLNQYKRTLSQMQVILYQIRERTKNFGLIMRNMTNYSVQMLRKKADLVDEYNQIKAK